MLYGDRPLWLDGDLLVTSGPGTRKARNLASNPACAEPHGATRWRFGL